MKNSLVSQLPPALAGGSEKNILKGALAKITITQFWLKPKHFILHPLAEARGN